MNENYDVSGNVNRISLKYNNGGQIGSLHFPPTLQGIVESQIEISVNF